MQVKKLSLTIGDKLLCHDIDLTINNGQMWAVLGCNGAGKTTLLHTLAGIHKAHQGEIYLNEQAINKLSRQKIAKSLAILFQNYEDVFPSTVLQTVLTGRHPHLASWQWESNDDLAIAKYALKIMGMNAYENRDITSLSGGERRRVAIAAIIAQTPDLFLLDEPTSHLDLMHQIQVLTYFQQLALKKQQAVVMVLHDINLAARFCNYMMMLFDDGYYLAGPKAEILTQENLQRLYHCPLSKIVHGSHEVWVVN